MITKKYKRFETLSKKAVDKKQYAVAVNAEFRSGQILECLKDAKEVTHVVENESNNWRKGYPNLKEKSEKPKTFDVTLKRLVKNISVDASV